MSKRRRATCIIELPDQTGEICILMSKQRGDQYDMLPGGGAERGEPLIIAAIREVREETALKSAGVVKLFEHKSQYTHHSVFRVLVESGDFEARDDVETLWLLSLDGCRELETQPTLSRSTKHVLRRYMAWRDMYEHEAVLMGSLGLDLPDPSAGDVT